MSLSFPAATTGWPVEDLIQRWERARAFSVGFIKWVLVLNLAIAWMYFWSKLGLLHLAMDDTVAAALTFGLVVAPFGFGLVGWVLTAIGVLSIDVSPKGGR